ncbi:hypothetical protein ABT024_12365 [Streptomyces sp. NPDC002812]|uniref:hypothetical protein n=1 Tax=unclassified Streptomyces TaxID=2593676 RepID=UPI00202ED54C|nr:MULTISPECIES: hypothetical protein [unclassified Streptomyces]MCM1966134.1 hypothetical protein [Streptomyces sp. G1]MCX5125764.1 hypothetical protein [Streptomyces sp. NBC_00347]MCX5298429.1 hypothetical protein [Streptomyces sp. NBC_00193]
MIKVRRTIGILAATVLAGALPVLVAPPAHATYGDCANYMRNLGYIVGPQVRSGCEQGATRGLSSAIGRTACQGFLAQAGVRPNHVMEACYQASRPA